MFRFRLPVVLVVLAFVVLQLAAHPAGAQQTNNTLLAALPVTRPLTLDGRLDNWDLSGEILMCYDLENMLQTHSVRAAAMYDADGLWLSFRFKDATPMQNHVHPVHERGNGWRSDCVQLRLWADPDKPLGPCGGRIANIDCYWYTDERRPVASVAFGDFGLHEKGIEGRIDDAIGHGIDAAFRPDADSRGYTQVMHIAWSLLRRDGRPYRPGESLRMGIECFWGDASGARWPQHRFADLVNPQRPQREFFWATREAWGEVRFLDHGRLAQPSASVTQLSDIQRLRQLQYHTEGPVPIHYELPHDAAVTLCIERPDGSRVRNLIADYPRPGGPNTDAWDGADNNGRLVPPGTYHVRGLLHDELDARYQFAYGTPGRPPWETSDGRGAWLADHVRPVGVSTDGTRMYLSVHMSEGGSTLLAVDAGGQKQWGVGRINGGPTARSGDYLYMLAGGGHPEGFDTGPGQLRLMRLDPAAGKFVAFADGKSEHVIATFPADRPVKPRGPEGETVFRKAYDADWLQREALGMAALGDRLYVTMFFEGKILVVDPQQGAMVGEIALARPTAVAADPDGARLLAVSGRQVVRIDPASRGVESVVAEGLEAPLGLAVDRRGNIYVADWGGAMCVHVFSPQGQPLRTIGTPGGRALSGAYDRQGMFRPWGLAIDAQDRLWVAEHDDSPRRFSIWSTADGRLLDELCGPTWYGGTECAVNPLEPTQAFAMGNTLALDWQTGRWRVTGTIWRPTHPQALLGPRGEGMVLQVFPQQQRSILAASRTGGFICLAELHADHARPLMAMGTLREFLHEGPLPEMVQRHLWDDPRQLAWAKEKFPALFGRSELHPHRVLSQMVFEARRRNRPVRNQFLWIDANGDGLVQESEIRFFAPEEAGGLTTESGWQFAVAPDLTLYPAAVVEHKTLIWRLPLRGWNACGTPQYDLADARQIVNVLPQYFVNSTWCDSRGNVLANHAPLQMFSPEGRALWSYPNAWPGVHGSHQAPKDRRGLLIGPLKVLGSAGGCGEAGEVFCLSGNMGKAFFMTTDGLYVGSLFRDCRSAPDSLPDRPRRGMSIGRTSPGAEWFGGEFFRSRGDGKLYIGSAAREGVLLSEVTGLESIRRLPEWTVEFSPAQYAQATDLAARRASEPAAAQVLTIARTKKRMPPLPGVADFRWPRESAAAWQYDTARAAEATWTFDDRNLYLCFRNVLDYTPMQNAGKQADTLFKTGDAVVFELRTRPDDATPRVIPGDLRLLLSVFEGKPIAVLYDYKAPGAGSPRQFSSPVTTTVVDSVRVLASARVAIDRQDDRYTLRASVSLAELKFAPQPGHSYRGDFGVIYSDRQGRIDELRMYWSNVATGLVSDLAIEAQIEPRAWGTWQIKED